MPSEVQGDEELVKKLNLLVSQVSTKGFGRALFNGGALIERLVKQNIRGKGLIDTGNYRASIRAVKVSDVRTAVFSHVVYGPIHEFGGTIRARRVPFLVFQINGQWIRVKQVTIPARPHWRPAIKENKTRILKEIGQAIELEIRKVV